MQLLGLVLVLINVGAILGPVGAVAFVYRDNLLEAVFPPEIEQLAVNTLESGREFALPEYIDSNVDGESRTITLTFSFTNPLNLDLMVNDVSADVQCTAHGYALGHAAITEAVELNVDETAIFTVIVSWTVEAENHFSDEHEGASAIKIDLANIVVDISGISIETPEHISVPVEIPIS